MHVQDQTRSRGWTRSSPCSVGPYVPVNRSPRPCLAGLPVRQIPACPWSRWVPSRLPPLGTRWCRLPPARQGFLEAPLVQLLPVHHVGPPHPMEKRAVYTMWFQRESRVCVTKHTWTRVTQSPLRIVLPFSHPRLQRLVCLYHPDKNECSQ